MSVSGDMKDLGFHPVRIGGGESVYQKWNPQTLTRTTLTFIGEGEKKVMHVKHEQPKWVTTAILEDNVARQNDFQGYKGADAYNAFRAPQFVWQQFLKKSGFKAGQGYDEKKMKSLINDPDYSKLKLVRGRI